MAQLSTISDFLCDSILLLICCYSIFYLYASHFRHFFLLVKFDRVIYPLLNCCCYHNLSLHMGYGHDLLEQLASYMGFVHY
jgi:hypothetical protein